MKGRVVSDHKGGTNVLVEGGVEHLAVISGKLRRQIKLGEAEKPVVGDVVELEPQKGDRAIIHAVLPRQTVVRRKAAGGEHETQVILANVDAVFVTMALNEDFNVRRLERYLSMVWDGGATPIVLLTKADLAPDAEEKVVRAKSVCPRERILVTSHASGAGLSALDEALEAGKTYALLGSSGVGKSTLVNRWLGQSAQAVKTIKDDGKGRHTTTHRELFLLPNGALVVDTPGMRELGLSDVEGGVSEAFNDVDNIAKGCRFSDCGHANEPDCAVQAALAAGALSDERYRSYTKLQRELQARAAGQSHESRAARKRRHRNAPRP
ncbi:MAG: ribosome small subunit-dependent GTPase A [Deltaproteobacteria bacterium]|nr:ribosome small subunit-dependent GTPase A [Deltaproteobacteria bacterium]